MEESSSACAPTKSSLVSVFISHTFQDREAGIFAILLNESLQQEGVATFIDMTILKTKEYQNEILEAVRSCDLFLCVLCPTYFNRQWCVRELTVALERKRPILPVFYCEIEETIHDTLLRDAKGTQGFRNPPVTKNDIVVLKNDVVREVKKQLGFVIPDGEKTEVSIRLAHDDVYKPSQKGWIMGKGCEYNSLFNFLAINARDQSLPRFRLRRSRNYIANENRYGYSIELIMNRSTVRRLVVQADSASSEESQKKWVNRDLVSKYVLLSPPKVISSEAESFPWRIVPQGNHTFHILYKLDHEQDDDAVADDDSYNHHHMQQDLILNGASVQKDVLAPEFMGLAAHRFWVNDEEKTDTQGVLGTKVMVSLQNDCRSFWEIRSVQPQTDAGPGHRRRRAWGLGAIGLLAVASTGLLLSKGMFSGRLTHEVI